MLLVVGVSGAHGPRVKVVRACHSRARETVPVYRRGRPGLLGVVLVVLLVVGVLLDWVHHWERLWAGAGVACCSRLRVGPVNVVVVVVHRRQLRAARRTVPPSMNVVMVGLVGGWLLWLGCWVWLLALVGAWGRVRIVVRVVPLRCRTS